MTSCGYTAKRSIFGSWNETAEIKVFVQKSRHNIGYFTLKQDQYYWADELKSCDLSLRFTSTTDYILSFNFDMNFQLRSPPHRYYDYNSSYHHGRERYNGRWTYTNAVVKIQPNETLDFGDISHRIVSIREGRIYVSITSPVTLERR